MWGQPEPCNSIHLPQCFTNWQSGTTNCYNMPVTGHKLQTEINYCSMDSWSERHVYSIRKGGGERGGETKMLTDKSDVSHWFNHVTQGYIKKAQWQVFAMSPWRPRDRVAMTNASNNNGVLFLKNDGFLSLYLLILYIFPAFLSGFISQWKWWM